MYSYDHSDKSPGRPRTKAASQQELPFQPHDLARSANALGTETPWWASAQFPQVGATLWTTPERLIGHGLLKKACEGGPVVRSSEWCGNLVVPPTQLLKTIESVLKLRPVWVEGGTKNGTHLFASDSTMVRMSIYSRGKKASVSAVTTDPKMVEYAGQLFDRCLGHDDPKKGMVFTLAKTMHGYTISHLGLAGSPIERGNYSKNVLAAYDHIVEDLNTENPCGRLVVLAGEPGSGKTYLIRSLLGSAPKAAFVLIPPHLVEELSGPDILPSLTAAKGEMSGPIVLVLEDADNCLVPRDNKIGNMNAISQLLNLGDGILGSVLDIRIIASTNAGKVSMDPATRRPGRLCKYAAVDALEPMEASRALYRLTGQARRYKNAATIATVYQHARVLGWKPPTRTASTSGGVTPVFRTEILDHGEEPDF